jgi:protein-disulfide isomerase
VTGVLADLDTEEPMNHVSSPGPVPSNATPDGDGLVFGAGPVRVDAFIDFLCPFCKRFELSAEPVLTELVGANLARIAYHPMNFLDDASTTNYSTRAAAASGCAADQGLFRQYAHALFASQPPEGGPGLTDADLAALGRSAGLDEPAFTACLSTGAYLGWPSYVTARATAAGVSSTPTVLVAGVPVRPDGRAIAAAVNRAAG